MSDHEEDQKKWERKKRSRLGKGTEVAEETLAAITRDDARFTRSHGAVTTFNATRLVLADITLCESRCLLESLLDRLTLSVGHTIQKHRKTILGHLLTLHHSFHRVVCVSPQSQFFFFFSRRRKTQTVDGLHVSADLFSLALSVVAIVLS